MNKRQKEIIEDCNYKVLSNENIIRDNKLLNKDSVVNDTKYYDVLSSSIGEVLIRCYNDSSLSVYFKNGVKLLYFENKDLFDNIDQNIYQIKYENEDLYKEISIGIYRFSKERMPGKIILSAKDIKGNEEIKYNDVIVNQFPDKSIVKGKFGNTIYRDSFNNTDMLFEVIMDYLNSLSIYSENKDITDLFTNISRFIMSDIDSTFKMMKGENDYYIQSYEDEMNKLTRYYNSRCDIIKKKIKSIKNIYSKINN